MPPIHAAGVVARVAGMARSYPTQTSHLAEFAIDSPAGE